ncbi:8964_t:CDS:2 [Ambispora gerdemannii]|uniref:8964_t:CDS:1 n=1 Tax=Ambispora gerdemannii TaxID=144530 RepID=A0A9N8W5G0_9GLOM|nr:8964_t:CDS:2 [Ambispora gerdemannii]
MSSAEAKLRSLKVPELKELLNKKGLPVSGKKEDLINRLLTFEVGEKVTTTTTTTDSSNISSHNNNSTGRNTGNNSININTKTQNNSGIISNGDNNASGVAGDNDTKTGDTDLFEKDIVNSPGDPNSALDTDFDWDDIKLTTDEFNDVVKDAELDSLHSLSSPIERTTDKSKMDNTLDKKPGTTSTITNTSTSIADSQRAFTSTTEPEIVVKPTGFKCKKITFNAPSQPQQSIPALNQSNDSNISSELEKRKKRAERFGVTLNETDKKLERAVKFGLQMSSPVDSPLKAERPIPQKKTATDDDEKLRQRTEKFNLTNVAADSSSSNDAWTTPERRNSVNSLNEEERKRIRAQRFSSSSTTTTTASIITDEEEKKRKRAEKFGLPVIDTEEEKRKKRAEKFATESANNTSSSPNVTTSSAISAPGGSNSASSLSEEDKKRKRAERFNKSPTDEPQNKKIKT